MSDNYDKFYVFAKAYGERCGMDILTIIRDSAMTPEDFYGKLSTQREILSLTVDAQVRAEGEFEKLNAKLHEPWKPFKDNGDGPAARLADDCNYKEQKSNLRRMCQKIREECDKIEAEIEWISGEIEKTHVERRAFWDYRLRDYLSH
jgi:hypothetical protein